MSTKRVTIQGPYALEGILNDDGQKAGVVICHPHPLYGGDMNNNVVEAMEEGFLAKGVATLRFNFRGVGGSDGLYGNGAGETEDLLAALQFLRDHVKPDAPIMLAGYSFGAWICVKASAGMEEAPTLFLVSYPFSVYESDWLRAFEGRIYLIGGDKDDISPVNDLLAVYKQMPAIHKFLKIIPTDHFYWGKEQQITDFIREQVTGSDNF